MADAFNRIKSSQAQLERTGLERLIWEGTQAVRAFAMSTVVGCNASGAARSAASRFQQANKFWSVIPQEPEEDPADYQNRIFRSYVVEFFKKAVTSDAGKVFADGVKIEAEKELDQKTLDPFIEDIDLQGTDADSFFVDVFENAEAFACVGVLIQFRNPGGSVILSDQRAAGARPYASKISSEQLLGWSFDGIRKEGEPTPGLESVRIAQTRVSYDDYEEVFTDQVLEVTRTQIMIWEKDKPAQVSVNTLGFVPFIECNLNRLAFMQGQPPYRGLADLNNQHLNASSDHSNILHYAQVPFLHLANDLESDGTDTEFRLAGNTIWESGPQSKAEWVEIKGKSVEEGAKHLANIKQDINTVGLDLLNFTERTTATGEKIDNHNNNSALKTLVPLMVDCITSTIKVMMIVNNTPLIVPVVELNTDFDEIDDSTDGQLIEKLTVDRIISKKTATASSAIARFLPEAYDFEADQKQIALESAEATRQNAETPAGVEDPENV